MNKTKWLVGLGLIMTLANPAVAVQTNGCNYETVDLRDGSFAVSPGQTVNLRLDSWRHIKKLVIQAEGDRSGGSIEVMSNGEGKGTIYVPGSDPSYVVTIAETANSLQFRHLSGGTVYVRAVSSLQSSCSYGGPTPERPSLPTPGKASDLAQQVLSVIDNISRLVPSHEFYAYLLPIKKSAGRAYAMAVAHGDSSIRTRAELESLRAQIDYAKAYLDRLMGREPLFDLAVELLSLREQIDEILD